MIRETRDLLGAIGKSQNKSFRLTLKNTIRGDILLKQMALKSGKTLEEYAKEFSENYLVTLESFILFDYDKDKNDFGDLTKEIFVFLKDVFELPDNFDFQAVETEDLIQIMLKATEWVKEESAKSFIPASDTTSENITGQ